MESIVLPIIAKWAAETNPALLIQNLIFLAIALWMLKKPMLWVIKKSVGEFTSPFVEHFKKIEEKFDTLTDVVEKGFKAGDERMTKIEVNQHDLKSRVERLENKTQGGTNE